jgi:ubiquinone/menaquinone biosynthesis C-methylase UbiE
MKPSVERFTGFADVYDQVRPSPPDAIAELLLQLAKLERAERVVDLGAGSGLSMLMWAGKTRSIVGVEPSDDMRREAQKRCVELFAPDQLEWVTAEADATGIAAQSVDIVTASQSFHWMNPDSTLPEIARILRPGGVFAAIDCDWPPSILPEVELTYFSGEAVIQESLGRSPRNSAPQREPSAESAYQSGRKTRCRSRFLARFQR